MPAAATAALRRSRRPAFGELEIPLGALGRRLKQQRLPQPLGRVVEQLLAPGGVGLGAEQTHQPEVVERSIPKRRVDRLGRLAKRPAGHVEASGLERGGAGIVERGIPRGRPLGLLEKLGGGAGRISGGERARSRGGSLCRQRASGHEQKPAMPMSEGPGRASV